MVFSVHNSMSFLDWIENSGTSDTDTIFKSKATHCDVSISSLSRHSKKTCEGNHGRFYSPPFQSSFPLDGTIEIWSNDPPEIVTLNSEKSKMQKPPRPVPIFAFLRSLNDRFFIGRCVANKLKVSINPFAHRDLCPLPPRRSRQSI